MPTRHAGEEGVRPLEPQTESRFGLARVRRLTRAGRLGMVALLAVLLVVATAIGVVTMRGRSGGDRTNLGGGVGAAAPLANDGPLTDAASASPATSAPTSAGPSQPQASQRAVPVKPRVGAGKKGVSMCCSFAGGSQAVQDVRASWFYNWSPEPAGVSAPNVEFVPMIWGRDSVTPGTIAKARKQGQVLLGFNEPDLRGQAEMSVTEALDLWPQLMATGMRLGSPAPAWGADRAGAWFDQFMSGVKARGYRIDFIALHWYGSDFSPAAVGQLRGYLQATHARYGLPIWLTEYSLMNFNGSPKFPTADQLAQFATASTAMLESLPYVERYAWFKLPTTESGDTGLYRDARTPTAAGVAYRAAGG